MAAVELTATRRVALAVAAIGLLAGCGARSIPGHALPPAPSQQPSISSGPAAGDESGVPAGPPTTSGSTATPERSPAAGGTNPASPPATVPTTAVPPDGGRPCPAAVAAALPGGGPAALVAGYETARFRLYYCRTEDGQLYYRGVSRIDPAGVVTVPAYPIADGFEAQRSAGGSTFVYQVKARVLRVFRDGTLLRADPVLRDL